MPTYSTATPDMTSSAISDRHLSKFAKTVFGSNFTGAAFCLPPLIGGHIVLCPSLYIDCFTEELNVVEWPNNIAGNIFKDCAKHCLKSTALLISILSYSLSFLCVQNILQSHILQCNSLNCSMFRSENKIWPFLTSDRWLTQSVVNTSVGGLSCLPTAAVVAVPTSTRSSSTVRNPESRAQMGKRLLSTLVDLCSHRQVATPSDWLRHHHAIISR